MLGEESNYSLSARTFFRPSLRAEENNWPGDDADLWQLTALSTPARFGSGLAQGPVAILRVCGLFTSREKEFVLFLAWHERL